MWYLRRIQFTFEIFSDQRGVESPLPSMYYNIIMLAGPQILLKFQCEYYVFTPPGLHVHSIVVTPDEKNG